VRIRNYETSDRQKCIFLLRQGHDPDFSEDRFRWLHEAAPLGPSSIAVCEDGNEIVGIYSVIRKTVRLGRKTYIGGRDVDPVVHPSYRGKGVFSRLLKFGLANFPAIDFFFNFANPASVAGFLKQGWKEVEALDDSVCQLGFSNPVSIDFILWLCTSARHGRHKATGCKEISISEADHLISAPKFSDSPCPPANRIWVERSSEYLKWRYLEHPLHEYLWFVMGNEESGGGLAICRVNDSRDRLYIIDFLGFRTETDLGNWLSLWRKRFPRARASAWSTIPSQSSSCFVRNPFRRGQGRKFLVRSFPEREVPPQLAKPGGWFITRGDLEIS